MLLHEYGNRPTCLIRRMEFYYLLEYNPSHLVDDKLNAITSPGDLALGLDKAHQEWCLEQSDQPASSDLHLHDRFCIEDSFRVLANLGSQWLRQNCQQVHDH